MPSPDRSYTRIRKKFEAGERSMLIDPFDYELMEMAQPEGMNVAGLYQIGTTSVEMAKKFHKRIKDNGGDPNIITPNVISGRLSTIHSVGLIKPVQMIGGRGAKAWQRTAEGEKELAAWRQLQK